jgi:hypothetical protein
VAGEWGSGELIEGDFGADRGETADGSRLKSPQSPPQLTPFVVGHQDGDSNFNGEHIREGLSCIVAVKVPNPEFEGQTKTRLGNPEVRRAVDIVVAEELTEALGFRLDVLGNIAKKAAAAARVRRRPRSRMVCVCV